MFGIAPCTETLTLERLRVALLCRLTSPLLVPGTVPHVAGLSRTWIRWALPLNAFWCPGPFPGLAWATVATPRAALPHINRGHCDSSESVHDFSLVRRWGDVPSSSYDTSAAAASILSIVRVACSVTTDCAAGSWRGVPNSEPATLGSADTLSIDTKESSIRSPRVILQASWKHDDLADAGYSIVEVLLAITILAVVLLAAARGVMGGLYAASVAKEHSVAAGLMSAAMAEAVALPISDLENGLNPTVDNLANDPNITTSGSTNCSATPPTSGYVLNPGWLG